MTDFSAHGAQLKKSKAGMHRQNEYCTKKDKQYIHCWFCSFSIKPPLKIRVLRIEANSIGPDL